MSPVGRMNHVGQVAATSTLRRAHLGPYEVIVLAAVEAVYREPGRQGLPDTNEVARAARLHEAQTLICLEGSLSAQGLVAEDAGYWGSCWALTPLGTEVLAELIKRERKGRPRGA